MRWIFLVLLSLNLGYIAWQMSMPATVSYADVAPLKNVQPIILLAELENKEPASVVSETKNKIEESSVTKADTVSAVPEVKIEAVVDDKKALAESNKAVAIVTKPKQKKSEQIVQTAATAASEGCYSLGPFRDLDNLRVLTREIMPYVKTTDFRGSEEQEKALYWVYVKPEKSYEKAIATGKRLKAKKIKDFYVISDGDKVNGLSLGRFRNKAGAYGLAKKVTKLGFDVLVEPLFKAHTLYWLDYYLEGAAIPENIFVKYNNSSKKYKISQLRRDCEG